jgi:hypothetical protein
MAGGVVVIWKRIRNEKRRIPDEDGEMNGADAATLYQRL